jgi:hypothetical protein
VISDCPTGITVTGGAVDCVVNGNAVRGNATYGVFVSTATGTQVTNNRIAAGAGRAIQLTSGTTTLVAGNFTTSSGNGSITTTSTTTGSVIANNRFDAGVFLGDINPVYRDLAADITNHGIEGFTTANYQRSVWKQGKATLSAVSGATVTATNLIPANTFLFGVTTRINTALGTTNGTTGYKVGDGTDDDLWGSITAVAANAATQAASGSSGATGFTADGASGMATTARSVVITATGGDFNGTGEIEVIAHYMICEAT